MCSRSCLGADLMNSVAETLLEGPPTPEARQQAERAVSQAVELIEIRRKRAAAEIQGEPDYCELVMAAALFNWGALREVSRKVVSFSRVDAGLTITCFHVDGRGLESGKTVVSTQPETIA